MAGLDYNVLYKDLDRLNLTADQFEDWKSDIQAMEHAALAAVNKQED